MLNFLRSYEIFTKRNMRKNETALVLIGLVIELPTGHAEWLLANGYLAEILAARAECSLHFCEEFLSEFDEYMRLMRAAQPLQYGG